MIRGKSLVVAFGTWPDAGPIRYEGSDASGNDQVGAKLEWIVGGVISTRSSIEVLFRAWRPDALTDS